MPLCTHRVEVHAPAHVVWEFLVDKIQHPERYVPGVLRAVVEGMGDPQCLVRTVELEGDRRIKERVSWTPSTRTVCFVLLEDAEFTGFVVNQVMEDEGRVLLEHTMNWRPRDGEDTDAEVWATKVREAALRTAAQAERRAAGIG